MIDTTEALLVQQLGKPLPHPAEAYGFGGIMHWRCGCLAFKSDEGQCNWLPCEKHGATLNGT